MKTPKERGADGLWLYESRRTRGYRNAETARLAVQAASGVYIAPSVYAEYESGRRRISDKHRPALVAFWGEPTAQAAEVPEATLIAALQRQTDAMLALTERLDRMTNGDWLGEVIGEAMRVVLGRARGQAESQSPSAVEESSRQNR